MADTIEQDIIDNINIEDFLKQLNKFEQTTDYNSLRLSISKAIESEFELISTRINHDLCNTGNSKYNNFKFHSLSNKIKFNWLYSFKKLSSLNEFKRSKILIYICHELGLISTEIINPKPSDKNTSINKLITHYCLIIEILHISSQLHSILESDTESKNIKISQKISSKPSLEEIVLFGDLLFTLALEKMLEFNNQGVVQHFVETTSKMAQGEANLADYSGNNKQDLIQLIEQKYWPLFNSIIYFFEFLRHNHDYKSSDLAAYKRLLSDYNKQYISNKIKQKKILVPKSLSTLIYS